jgi:hypothetical protein
LVDEIVSEMNRRMKQRGDTAQIQRTEDALAELKLLREELGEVKSDMKLVLSALNVEQEESMKMER